MPRQELLRVLVEVTPPDSTDAGTVHGVLLHPVCQEELCNPGRDVSINLNQNSILTHPRPLPDVRLGHTLTRHRLSIVAPI